MPLREKYHFEASLPIKLHVARIHCAEQTPLAASGAAVQDELSGEYRVNIRHQQDERIEPHLEESFAESPALMRGADHHVANKRCRLALNTTDVTFLL
jgi:hypothetical protein